MKKMLMLAMLLLLPACALAVTEGVVETAPQVEMEEIGAEAQVSYLPDASYYLDYGDWQPEWAQSETHVPEELAGEYYEEVTQLPGLTQGEIVRAKKLLESYQAGEAAGDGAGVLNARENVVVGVYALDPDDYDGEKAFVILPGTNLTDEQLLAIIDAYAQLGLTFEPEGLNDRNSARGGGIECTRFFSQEERERYVRLARLIESGLLDVSGFDTKDVLRPKLDERYFCGMMDFSFLPYRMMTDEELAAMLVEMGVHDLSGELDSFEVEKQSRQVLYDMLGCPLSMELDSLYYEGGYIPQVFDAQGNRGWLDEGRRSYGANFSYRTAEGIQVSAQTEYDWETGELVSVSTTHMRDWEANHGPSVMQIDHEHIVAATQEIEERFGYENLTWRLEEQEWMTDWGTCRVVRAQIAQDLWLTVYIGGDDGKEHGLSIDRGTLVEEIPGEPENNG